MKYVIQKTTGSFCYHCTGLLDLLIEDRPKSTGIELPMFYICYKCKKVYHIGVGEVVREDP